MLFREMVCVEDVLAVVVERAHGSMTMTVAAVAAEVKLLQPTTAAADDDVPPLKGPALQEGVTTTLWWSVTDSLPAMIALAFSSNARSGDDDEPPLLLLVSFI